MWYWRVRVFFWCVCNYLSTVFIVDDIAWVFSNLIMFTWIDQPCRFHQTSIDFSSTYTLVIACVFSLSNFYLFCFSLFFRWQCCYDWKQNIRWYFWKQINYIWISKLLFNFSKRQCFFDLIYEIYYLPWTLEYPIFSQPRLFL